jgi:polyhydroxyalkanoate synthesis regulator phasin
MTAEEARKYVDDLIQQAQQPTSPEYIPQDNSPKEPRPIEILDENEDPTAEKTDQLKKQVEALEEELRRLKRQ